MRLFLAEKPSLGRAIAAVLGPQKKEDGFIRCGENDIVSWCFGHILSQCAPEEYDEKYARWNLEDLPILPEQWKLKVSPGCEKQFKIIKRLAGQADEIVNAGDPDREGQLLIDEVLSYIGVLGKKPVRRILLNALDEKSVREALGSLRDNREFIGLRNSALARSRADWIIGMNLSRVATIKAREAGHPVRSVSVGRVMTPTAALVIRREDAIKNFRPVDFFQLRVTWHHPQGDIVSQWQPKENQEGLDGEGRILASGIVEEAAKKIEEQSGRIAAVEQKEGQAQQRLPYSLSSLQIEAGKKFGYSPQQVLDAQQELYEKRLASYPRSDCEYLPTNQLAQAGQILANLSAWSEEFHAMAGGADTGIRSRAWNDKKISAHHAIIPTTVKAEPGELTDIQRNLYDMVARAYLAQFYPAQKFRATKIRIEAAGETFQASGKVILENGWRSLYGEEKTEEESGEADRKLPKTREGDEVLFSSGEALAKRTTPPKRFTPASLIEAMKKIHAFVKDASLKPVLKECSGIGTEATRAETIEKIQRNDFVRLEKKFLVPTETGRMMLSFLSDSITYPDITAQWEKSLDAISRKEMGLQEFFGQQADFIRRMVEEEKAKDIAPPKNLPQCPKCKKPLKRIQSKKNKKFYWVCQDRACDAIFSDKGGKPDLAPPPKKTASSFARRKTK